MIADDPRSWGAPGATPEPTVEERTAALAKRIADAAGLPGPTPVIRTLAEWRVREADELRAWVMGVAAACGGKGDPFVG